MTGVLSGRTALVTGGSRGIGAATARALAGLGARVVITYRKDAESAGRVVEDCRALSGAAEGLHADLGDAQGAEDLVAGLRGIGAEVDVAVSNATTSHLRLGLVELPTEDLLAKVDADLAVPHRLLQRLIGGMQQRGFGRFIVISSGHAVGPSARGMAAYGVAKAALEALVRYAAAEEGHSGVTVNAVRPSFVLTDASRDVPRPVREAMRKAVPAGRLAVPEDVAGIVSLLAQPAAGWINGVSIPATGGLNHPVDWARLIGSGAGQGGAP